MSGSLKTYRSGLWAEYWAALYLVLKGVRPLKFRFKTPVGEIDIIGKTGRYVVFVEVKKRMTLDDAAYAISAENASRVRRAAQWWLQKNAPLADKYDIRFDAVVIAGYARIKHIKNAF